MSFFEELDHVSDDTAVATIEESCRFPSITSTAGTSNTMNIVVDIGWKIVVDNVSDIGNIQATLEIPESALLLTGRRWLMRHVLGAGYPSNVSHDSEKGTKRNSMTAKT